MSRAFRAWRHGAAGRVVAPRSRAIPADASVRPDLEALEPRVLLGGTSFVPLTTFPASYGGLTAIDADGDGHSDLVAVGGGGLAIYRGITAKGVSAGPGVNLAYYANDFAAGDFNEDGRVDLAVASNLLGTVVILLQRPDGSFGSQSISVPKSATRIAAGDFNGDHHTDLVVVVEDRTTYTGDTQFVILLGRGDGTFQALAPAYPPSGTLLHTVRDLNGDGKSDLLFWNSYRLWVYLGQGDGTFHSGPVFHTPSSVQQVAFGDFNGDGRQDVACFGNPYGANPSAYVALGNGDGSFAAPQAVTIGSNPTGLVVGDFDADGRDDLAVGYKVTETNASGSVSILRSLGDGTFAADTNIAVADQGASGMVVGDFNGDGAADLAVEHQARGVMSVYLNTTAIANPPALTVTDTSGVATDQSVTFPDTTLGQTSTGPTFTLRNGGSRALVVSGLANGGTRSGDFTAVVRDDLGNPIPGGSFSIGAGQTYTVAVTFAPASAGARSGAFTWQTNDASHPTLTLSATGNGLFPADWAGLGGTFGAAVRLPAAPAAGDTFVVPVTLTNAGPLALRYNVRVTLQASADGAWHEGAPALGTWPSQAISLTRGTAVTRNILVTVPAMTALPPGDYKLVGKLEVLIGNTWYTPANPFVTAVTGGTTPVALHVVPALPDITLSFGNPNLPYSTYVPGDWASLPITVRNIGNRPAVYAGMYTTPAPMPIAVSLSTDTTFDNQDAPVFVWNAPWPSVPTPFPAGAVVTMVARFQVPSWATPGRYYLVGWTGLDSGTTNGQPTELDATNNAATATTPLNLAWQFGAVPGRAGSVPLTFTEYHGAQEILSLTGGGTGQVTDDANGARTITVTGTTAASVLAISTIKGSDPSDTGRYTLPKLVVGNPNDPKDHTALGSLIAPTTDMDTSSSLTITGPLTRLVLGNVGNTDIGIGAPAKVPAIPPTVTLSFDQLHGAGVTSAIGIASLTATCWQDGGILTAPFLGTLVMRGNPAQQVTGDFSANLTLTAAHGLTAASPTLQVAVITGWIDPPNSVYSASMVESWNISGPIGSVTVTGGVGSIDWGFDLEGATDIALLNLGLVEHATIRASGKVGAVIAQGWEDGNLMAQSLGALSIIPNPAYRDAELSGDFGAALTLTGPAPVPGGNVLGAAYIARHVAGAGPWGSWDITGKIGSIRVGGALGETISIYQTPGPAPFDLIHATDIGVLSFGDVVDGTIQASGNIGAVTAERWQAGSISAKTLGWLVMTGYPSVPSSFYGFPPLPAIPADFAADLTLTGPTAVTGANVLGSAVIPGHLGGGTWDLAGKVGAIQALGTVGDAGKPWQLQSVTGAAALVLGDVAAGSVTATGNLALVQAKRWQSGTIQAPSLGVLNIIGGIGLAGSFGAELHLTGTGDPRRPLALTSAYVADVWSAPASIAGDAGSLRIHHLQAQLSLTGAAAAVVLDDAVSVTAPTGQAGGTLVLGKTARVVTPANGFAVPDQAADTVLYCATATTVNALALLAAGPNGTGRSATYDLTGTCSGVPRIGVRTFTIASQTGDLTTGLTTISDSLTTWHDVTNLANVRTIAIHETTREDGSGFGLVQDQYTYQPQNSRLEEDNAALKILPATLTLNKAFTSTSPITMHWNWDTTGDYATCPGTTTFTITFLGYETVSLPGGTFLAAKFVRTWNSQYQGTARVGGRDVAMGEKLTESTTWWVAPSVGLLKEIDSTTDTVTGGTALPQTSVSTITTTRRL